jgi:methylthioribose-1-phosphate isomerase
VPAADVIPAGTIAALVTERGVLVPPSAPAIAELIASSEATAPIGPPETAS